MITSAERTMEKQLKNPFPMKFVKVRVGATSKDKKKGIPLFYIDAREVMKRLDEVCGIFGWQRKVQNIEGGATASIAIKNPFTNEWVEKADAGENSKTSPIKGASSDAFKRAAANWGIGRYLYYIPNRWCPLNEYKQFETLPELPEWAQNVKNIESWEEIAEKEYNPKDDVGLDEVDFTDMEAERTLTEAKHLRDQIAQHLKAQKND